MVQPYLAAVDTDGERSLLFFGGDYSHSVTKNAMLTGPAESTDELFRAETITPRTATPSRDRDLQRQPVGGARRS